MQIFNEVNAERTKAGLPALVWDENLYAGTKIRAIEFVEWASGNSGYGPHDRLDGGDFYTAVTENSSYTPTSFYIWGENCAGATNYNNIVNGWMNSSAHRENILSSLYTKCAIAVHYCGNAYYATNIFVG